MGMAVKTMDQRAQGGEGRGREFTLVALGSEVLLQMAQKTK